MKSNSDPGGRTSGGGAGRDHPAHDYLEQVQDTYAPAYDSARSRVDALVSDYIRQNGFELKADHIPGGKTSGGGTGRFRTGFHTRQSDALDRLFRGLRWITVRAEIVLTLYRANVAAMRFINDALSRVFAEGATQSEWRLQKQVEYYPLPYTEAVVEALARDNLLTMPTRTVYKSEDTAWLRRVLLSVIAFERLQDTPPDELPANIARHLTRRCQQAMNTTAQAMIYGVFDMGMYQAGLDALDAGLDVEKTWLSILDNRVRDSHRHLHAKTLPMPERFRGFHGTLRFPHDPTSPPAETYNCRCRMAVHLAGHVPRTPTGPLRGAQLAAYKRWRDETIDALGGALALEAAQRRRFNAHTLSV